MGSARSADTVRRPGLRPPTTSPPPDSPWLICTKKHRRARRTLIRCDAGGGTHEFLAWLGQCGRWLSYSVGMVITEAIHQHVLQIPASARTPAVETGGEVRDGVWVAELTGDLLDGWPQGMRLIVRKERPIPGPS